MSIERIREALAAGPTRKPIPSCAGYEADSEGYIWSVASNWRGIGSRRISAFADKGYLRVRITSAGKRQKRPVHQLVCEAFHGERPDGKEVRHIDGNPLNNKPTNLAWGTRSENAKDRQLHGTEKATQNGLRGALSTREKFAHLARVAICPVCENEFRTRAWKIAAAVRRSRLLTCSTGCARRAGAAASNEKRAGHAN